MPKKDNKQLADLVKKVRGKKEEKEETKEETVEEKNEESEEEQPQEVPQLSQVDLLQNDGNFRLQLIFEFQRLNNALENIYEVIKPEEEGEK